MLDAQLADHLAWRLSLRIARRADQGAAARDRHGASRCAASSAGAGIGVPLVDKNMAPPPPMSCRWPAAIGPAPAIDRQTAAAVFVTPTGAASPADFGTVARIFSLTPAEARLLQHLASGASLTEAASALGITEATARTHRNHIFTKTGRVAPHRSAGPGQPPRPSHPPPTLTLVRPRHQPNGLDRSVDALHAPAWLALCLDETVEETEQQPDRDPHDPMEDRMRTTLA